MLQERVAWAAATLLLCAIAGYAAMSGGTVLFAALAALAVAAVAAKPSAALLAIIPIAMWPEQPVVAGFPLAYGAVALVEVGVLVGCASRIGAARKPVLVAGAFVIVMTAAFLNHGPPFGVTASEQRNHFIAFMLGVWLVPTAALARPSLRNLLRVATLSGVAASAYSYLFAERAAGRASFEQLNSDVLGCAAAVAALLVIVTARIERRNLWLWLLPAPASAFFAAQTRSALVVLAVGLLAMWLLGHVGPKRVIAVCFGLAVLPSLIGPALAFQRAIFSQRDARFLEVESRFKALDLALSLVRENPLLGVGYRHFPDEAAKYFGFAINAHNDFALLAAENGLPAVILFACLLVRVLTFKHADQQTQVAIRALLIAAFAAFAFGNVLTDLRMTAPGWLLLGLVWTYSTQRQESAGRCGQTARRYA